MLPPDGLEMLMLKAMLNALGGYFPEVANFGYQIEIALVLYGTLCQFTCATLLMTVSLNGYSFFGCLVSWHFLLFSICSNVISFLEIVETNFPPD